MYIPLLIWNIRNNNSHIYIDIDGSFSENFYGLKRVQVANNNLNNNNNNSPPSTNNNNNTPPTTTGSSSNNNTSTPARSNTTPTRINPVIEQLTTPKYSPITNRNRYWALFFLVYIDIFLSIYCNRFSSILLYRLMDD